MERAAATGATGDFAFSALPEGDYEITTEVSGFEQARRRVRVQAGERVSASLTLHAANLEETIVTATRMGQREVQTLPMAITALSNVRARAPRHVDLG